MSSLNDVMRNIKNLFKPLWCKVSLAWFAFFSQQAIDKYLTAEMGFKEALNFGWIRAVNVVQLPAVQLAAIPLALWMFERGVNQLQRCEEQSAADERERSEKAENYIRSQVSALQRSVKRGPHTAMRALMMGRELEPISKRIEQAADYLTTHKSELLARIESQNQVGYQGLKFRMPHVEPEYITSYQINVPRPALKAAIPKFENSGHQVYVPENNKEFIDAIRYNFHVAEEYVSRLRQERDAMRQKMNALIEEAMQEAQSKI